MLLRKPFHDLSIMLLRLNRKSVQGLGKRSSALADLANHEDIVNRLVQLLDGVMESNFAPSYREVQPVEPGRINGINMAMNQKSHL